MYLYFNFLAWIFKTFEKKKKSNKRNLNAKVYCCDCERERHRVKGREDEVGRDF